MEKRKEIFSIRRDGFIFKSKKAIAALATSGVWVSAL